MHAYPLSAREHRHINSLSIHGDLEKVVTYPDCEEIRTRRHRGQTVPEIHDEMNLNVHRSQVTFHATGRCQHYDGVPPAPSKSPVTWVRCRAMRQLAHLGVPREDIVERAPVPMHPVSLGEHIRGDCGHDIDVEGVRRDFVTATECESFRRRVLDGESANQVSKDCGRDFAGVRRHLIGECGHSGEIPPLRYNGQLWEEA